eukprot:CAMPEP_0115872044 /NCGR_PEP_ID=MMETSP0287-20121206/23211_1 /TAXON_ID=412157 /ORGANISM="Chrysochromulina rotalis, Strain UIO044" /LENGTH=46 /DNA_ID= /DNA_START= /DNA_END= /DNA_ORIENTATION=
MTNDMIRTPVGVITVQSPFRCPSLLFPGRILYLTRKPCMTASSLTA